MENTHSSSGATATISSADTTRDSHSPEVNSASVLPSEQERREDLRALPAMNTTNKTAEQPKEEASTPAEENKDEPKPKPEQKGCRKKISKKSDAKSKAKSTCSKSKKPVAVDSEDSDSSSSDSSDSSDSESSESSSEDESSKRRKKKSKKKARFKRSSKKSRRQSSSDEDSSETSSSEEDRKPKKKSRKAKKPRRVQDDEESEGEGTDLTPDQIEDQIQQLNLLYQQATQKQQQQSNALSRSNRRANNRNIKPAKKTKSSKKSSTKPQYFRGDELWDREVHDYRLRETAEAADDDEFGDYVFHVRRRFDWEGKYVDTLVDIKTKSLRSALQEVMGSCKAVSLAEETPSIDPNMLFLYLEELQSHLKDLKKQSKTLKKKKKKERKTATQQAAQLKLLIKYVNKDYATVKKTLYPLLEAGNITFDLLWTLFRSDEIVYTSTYSAPDEPRAFKVEYASKECSFMKGTWFAVDGKYIDFDGKQFGLGDVDSEIDYFKGTRRITSLPCYPLKYHKEVESIKEQLIERGKKFVGLAGMKYMSHVGLGFTKRKRQILKVSTNTRVMVDPQTFRRINPNYPISTIKAQNDYLDDPDYDSDDECSCHGHDDGDRALEETDANRTRLKLYVDKKKKYHIVEVEVDEDGNEINAHVMEKLLGEGGELKKEFSEEELLIASPVVLGFAFSEKLWLEFTVSGVQEIEWNEGAFDSLVLAESQKSIVKALVQSHTTEAEERKTIDDVIKGKGKGLVAVLHGTPGVGKTLTAEGIAELLKCPLYCVSAGELGTNPRELEAELTKILDVAHCWGAVLLLDEADVFMEARTAQDIHRNALVSIFLRVLEYFQGILFLTTNRVSTFDDAFQSRIHVALRYQELDFKARRTIFKMFIEKVAQTGGPSKELPPPPPSSPADKSSKSPASSAKHSVSPSIADSTTFTNVCKADAEPEESTPCSPTPSTRSALSRKGTNDTIKAYTNTPVASIIASTAVATFTDADLDRLARKEHLNGRQIKNAVRSAQALAVNEKVPMSMSHVLKVLEVAEAFERDLKGGSGYLEAMRSYT